MRKYLLAATAVSLAVPTGANAALVTYNDSDEGLVSSLAEMPNSVAASASFDAATPGSTLVDFEGALPAGFSFVGGSITSNSGCGALCGFNTSPGGQNFLSLTGGSTTFSFANAVDSFGFYITGLQASQVGQQTVTFFDGSQQVIDFPEASGGGGAFIGFTDFGKAISSVSVNVSNDIVAIDDVRYTFGGGAVPEPATWALMILGFGMVGGKMRTQKRREKLTVRYA